MATSFDPDWWALRQTSASTATPTLPAGSPGDTLVVFILSTRDVWDWPWADGYVYEVALSATTPGGERYVNIFSKVREVGETAPTFGFAAACASTVIIGNLPGDGYAFVGQEALSGFTGESTVGPYGVLAGAVWSQGSGSLNVTYPASTFDDIAELIDDGPNITDRITVWAWEPPPSTPTFEFTSDGDLRRVFFVAKSTGRWHVGSIKRSG